MGRYWRIYSQFFRSSIQRELEFRANFFAKVLQNAVWLFFFFTVLLVIYRNTDSVGGWNRGDAIVLAATVFIMTSIMWAFCHSLYEVPEQVRKGTLDFVVVKPIDSQFWVSLRRFRFEQLGSMIAGLILLGYGLSQVTRAPDWQDWLAYLTLFMVSGLLYYSLILALMTLSIYFVRIDNLWVLGETVIDVARFPMSIFSPAIQNIITFWIPFAFLASLPAMQLVRGADWKLVAVGLTWTLVGLFVSRWFWRFSLRRYTSASS